MAADDDAKAGRGRVDLKLFNIVDNVDADFSDFDDGRFRKLVRPFTLVIIASNRNDGGDRLQSRDYLGLSDVVGVDDQVGVSERLKRLRPEQAVGI